MLQKFTIQRREEEHENQKRLLRKKKKKKVSTADWPSAALQKQAFISRSHRRLTSNFCFSLWSLRVSGLRLKARLLSSRRLKFSKRCTAESWRGKTSFLSCRGKKKKKNSNRLKHFRLIATGIKTQQIFLGHPHSDEVKVGSNSSGSLIVQFLVSHFALCHWLMRSFHSSWVQHVTASVDKWTLSGRSG